MTKINYQLFVKKDNLPKNFQYPKSYTGLDIGKFLIEPWHFYYSSETLNFHKVGLANRYRNRILIPFARRFDNDDVACFDGSDTSDDPRVIIIHDWASPGWENHGEFNNFLEWLEFAKEEAKEWKMLGGQ